MPDAHKEEVVVDLFYNLYMKELFSLFPDYPDIRQDSMISEYDLQLSWRNSTKEQRDDKIEEYVGLGIIEPYRNKNYRLTDKGWEIWCKTNI